MTAVVVSYVRARTGVEGPFVDSLAAMLTHDARHRKLIVGKCGGTQTFTSGPDLAGARNLAARTFLASRADWWLSLDTDMAFAPDLCDRLVTAADPKRRPIVGALCLAVPETRAPYVPWHFFDRDRAQEHVTVPRDALVEVDGWGMAATLIHRGVVEHVFHEYGGEPFTASGIGEDLAWCQRVRAAGYPIFVHTGIHAGHVKPFAFWPGQFVTYTEEEVA